MAMNLGRVGVWQRSGALTPEVVAELEDLGYGAVWFGGSPDGRLEAVEAALGATERIVVATGIVNMWKDDAATVAASFHRIEESSPGRFLLGVGVGHREATSDYTKPYDKIVGYLDELDAAGVPPGRRVLAALGPKVLKLAAQRCAGAHPYLTTPAHTASARALVGPGVLLAPEQKVVVDSDDPERAKAVARAGVKNPYLGLVNYRQNLLRTGFTEADLAGDGSDALIDALAPQGDAKTVAGVVNAHLAAGADHVCVQVLGDNPLPGYRALAEVLL